jgi:hypothetical protein
MSQQDDERIARKLLDLGSRSDRVQIRNGITYLDGYALGNGTVEIRSQVVRDRRMRMRDQAVAPALFSLWGGPDGYYVVNGAGVPTLVAPYFDNGPIFRNGFTAVGTNDWRFSAVKNTDVPPQGDLLFYGPSGVTASYTVPFGHQLGGRSDSGLISNSLVQNSQDRVLQRYWYTETAQGNGPNTFPDIPDGFILPGLITSDTGTIYSNADLSWAVRSGQLLKADGTLIPITSGEPDPWPDISNINSQSACFVGLTLFVFDWPPVAPSITFTPYRYDPDTGTATAETPIVMPYATPGVGYTLRHLSFWSPTP